MESYRDLSVWQKSMDLVEEVYSLVKKLPHEEQFALSSQIRRAVVSIPSNIAEGYGRKSKKEYIRFLQIARGSKYEVETQLLICSRLGYLQKTDLSKSLDLCDEIGKMLNTLIKKLTPLEPIPNPQSPIPNPQSLIPNKE